MSEGIFTPYIPQFSAESIKIENRHHYYEFSKFFCDFSGVEMK